MSKDSDKVNGKALLQGIHIPNMTKVNGFCHRQTDERAKTIFHITIQIQIVHCQIMGTKGYRKHKFPIFVVWSQNMLFWNVNCYVMLYPGSVVSGWVTCLWLGKEISHGFHFQKEKVSNCLLQRKETDVSLQNLHKLWTETKNKRNNRRLLSCIYLKNCIHYSGCTVILKKNMYRTVYEIWIVYSFHPFILLVLEVHVL